MLPDDAAPELAPVASLIASARSAGTEAELGRLDSDGPAMVAVLRGNGAMETATESAAQRAGARRAVGIVLASVLGLGMVGAAAAATLQQPWRPAPAASTGPSTADAATGGASTDPDEQRRSGPSTATSVPPSSTVPGDDPVSDTATPVGPGADGPARQGLCTAFGARSEMPGSSVAATNLRRAAEASGTSVEQFCSDVDADPTDPVGRPDDAGPPAERPGADGSGDDRPAPPARPPADTPAVTAPAAGPAVPTLAPPAVGGAGSAPGSDATADDRTQGR
jgi:hypothetical protein